MSNLLDELKQEREHYADCDVGRYAKLDKIITYIENQNNTINYLEGFIKFCKCGNPVDDCVCGA